MTHQEAPREELDTLTNFLKEEAPEIDSLARSRINEYVDGHFNLKSTSVTHDELLRVIEEVREPIQMNKPRHEQTLTHEFIVGNRDALDRLISKLIHE